MTPSPVVESYVKSIKQTAIVFHRVLGDDLTVPQTMYQVEGRGSNIAWLIGHLGWTADIILNAGFGRQPVMDKGFHEMFSVRSQPLCDASKYPSLVDLRGAFDRTHAAAFESLSLIRDEQLGDGLPASHPAQGFFKDHETLLAMTIYHIGYHTGQVTLLRKAQGLKAGMGV